MTMSVIERNTIDITSIETNEERRNLVLYISDHLEWGEYLTENHLRILQDKLNDYLDFITSDQVLEHYSKEQYDCIVIRVLFSFQIPDDAKSFLARASQIIKEAGYSLEWKYDPR